MVVFVSTIVNIINTRTSPQNILVMEGIAHCYSCYRGEKRNRVTVSVYTICII